MPFQEPREPSRICENEFCGEANEERGFFLKNKELSYLFYKLYEAERFLKGIEQERAIRNWLEEGSFPFFGYTRAIPILI